MIAQGSITEHIYDSLLRLYTKYDSSSLRSRFLQCLGEPQREISLSDSNIWMTLRFSIPRAADFDDVGTLVHDNGCDFCLARRGCKRSSAEDYAGISSL